MGMMLDTAIRAAREAGRVLVEAFHGPHTVHVKGLRDISTEADIEAEQVAMRTIREDCPEARFIAEESSEVYRDYGNAPTWYVDPLDGTTNYARGLPMFTVSVAMARCGDMECGAVYDPLLDHLFYAERGQGAYLNGKRLQVSSCDRLMDSVILLDWPRDPALLDIALQFLARLAPQVGTVRSRGSAASGLCCVAAGWADAYFQFTLKPWDVAAGTLILEEAGGQVTGLRGQPYRLCQPDWLVSNSLIHESILAAHPYG